MIDMSSIEFDIKELKAHSKLSISSSSVEFFMSAVIQNDISNEQNECQTCAFKLFI